MLKTIGVTQVNQQAQRQENQSLPDNHLETKDIHLEFRNDQDPDGVMGVTVKPAPYIFVTNIKKFLFERLHRLHDNGSLYWHQDTNRGSLPTDIIYVKVGEDKGQGSVNICMQICNVRQAKWPDNTIIIGAFEANYTSANLAIALDGTAHQLEELDGSLWGEGDATKHIILFGSGDHDFKSKVVGIAGACGTYPCMYCKFHRKDMQVAPVLRLQVLTGQCTIEDPNSDYLWYASMGQMRVKNQAQYNNVVNPPLLHIEPDNYCLPYLHCLLGIIKKHHGLQEMACNSLDTEIAIDMAQNNSRESNQTPIFDKYI